MTNTTRQEPKYVISVLAFIVLTSLVMNVWGIKKNLPYAPEVDEKTFWVGRAVMMASTGSANPGWFGHPGSTVLYPMAAVFRLCCGERAQAVFDTAPSGFYIAGRLLIILYASMSIPLIYLVGKNSLGTKAGLVGAWLFVFYPLALSHFQIVRTDSSAVFFGILSLWRILEVSKKSTLRNQLLAGLCIGLSIASRYFMVALVPVLLVADGMAMPKATSKSKAVIAVSAGVLATVLVFAATTPYFFLDFGTALSSLRVEARTEHVGADGLSHLGNLRWYLTSAIPAAITWPQFWLAVLGISLAIWRRRFVALLLLVYVSVFLFEISLSALHWSRWVIPILPILALFVAFALDNVSMRIFKTRNSQLIALVLCTVAISSWPVYQSILYDVRAANPSTRVLARNWIVKNLPPGSKIAQEWYTALLDDTDFIVTEQFSLAQNGSLASYSSNGYDYLVVSDNIYRRFFSEPDRYPREIEFYNTLFAKGQLLYEVKQTDIRGGPTIHVYQLDHK